MVAPVAALALVVLIALPSASAAVDRLQVPGGTKALRAATELPDSVSDDRLLVEAARAWYGSRDPLVNAPRGLQQMIGRMRSGSEPLADGPPLPMTTAAWRKLLACESPCNLAATLVANRNAMLLYHGLIAMDRETQAWMAARPALLADLLADGAAAFAFAGPFVHVRDDMVAIPGGEPLRSAWLALLGDGTSHADSFVRALMRRDGGRLAWLFSVLAQLDPVHRRFALAGGDAALSALARFAVSSSPEWTIAERPFWRTPFDFTLVLAFIELADNGAPLGSRAFWREVFRSDDLANWRSEPGEALTAPSLLELIFAEPYLARERWEIFALGQRLPGVEADAPDAGRMLRGARRHPALGQMLDRIGISSPAIVLPIQRASARIFDRDGNNARGELGAWQGALAIVERASLSGGLDRSGTEAALSGLGALPLDNPRSELTDWFIGSFVSTLSERPDAPEDAERVVLQAMSGRLTREGSRREPTFTWEDLSYSFGAASSLVTRMEEARAAQNSASVQDARVAWRIASGQDLAQADTLVSRLRDVEIPTGAADMARRLERARGYRDGSSLRREARRAAEAIVVAILPAIAYAPHLAVSEMPSLGADVAFRHEFVSPDDGPYARRQRPWQTGRGQAAGGRGWRLQGSLLLLDLALAEWYLRHNGDPADAQPMLDEGDMTALAQVAALARSAAPSDRGVAAAAAAIDRGRQSAAAAPSMATLDRMLDEAGVDPWRRWAIAAQAPDPAQAAAALSYTEAWRLGGSPGLWSPHPAIDGGAHFGAAPRSLPLMEGRRSAGAIGASAIDAQLRVAAFLHARGLPDRLFGDVAAGVIAELIQKTVAARPDDFTAFAMTVAAMDDIRLEEHLLALVADGTLARPSDQVR